MGPETLRFEVEEEQDGQRLDAALALLAGVPRAQVRRWVDDGRVRLNDAVARASRRVAAGDAVVAEPPEPSAARPEPQALPLSVVHEDRHLIVIDKAAGMVVHPAPGHPDGTLVNVLLHHCRDLAGIGGVLRPGIVHRLDQGTSGILVVAKDDATHHGLSEQFRDHTIERVYHAFVRGTPGADAGRVDRPIGRHPRDRKRMSVRTRSGREAHTAWRVAARYPRSGVARLEVRPETGRTHQIRVHLSSVGMPLVGDPVYGRGQRGGRGLGLARPALHAARLGFEHPATGEALVFEAPLPSDLARLVDRLEAAEGPR